MIDEVDARLKAWVEDVVGTTSVALTPPRDAQTAASYRYSKVQKDIP